MIDFLNKFQIKDHFFFSEEDDLRYVCNAPKDAMGVYYIYALERGKVNLVYIGASGKILHNGNARTRSEGIFDRIVNGKQFEGNRAETWKQKLIEEDIDTLDI